jgi:hypothetical protein
MPTNQRDITTPNQIGPPIIITNEIILKNQSAISPDIRPLKNRDAKLRLLNSITKPREKTEDIKGAKKVNGATTQSVFLKRILFSAIKCLKVDKG